MEFKVTTDLSIVNPQEITFNKDEIKQELAQRLEMYKGMLVTEETIADAKKVRANINKLEKAINDEKLRVKRVFTAPYIKFESDVKEIMAMCSAVSGQIDAQVKELENQKKIAKRNQIIEYFNQKLEEKNLEGYVSFELIEDPKWMNTTVPIDGAFEIINERMERFAEDIKTIKETTDDELLVGIGLDNYKVNHNLSGAITAIRIWKANKERIEAEKREKEEAKQAAMEAARIAREEIANREAKAESSEETMQEIKTEEEHPAVHEITFRIWATKEQLSKLRLFLTDNGIKYGRA